MSHHDYYAYLRNRSRLGLFYRNNWLYPQLCAQLTGRVLDIGCGIGDFLAFRQNTIGVDINPETVAWCLERGLDVRLMEQDHLPFKDMAFDGVILDNVLEHLESPLPLLGEIARVLASRGKVIVGVPGERGYASDPDHKIYYDEQALEEVMRRVGFTLQKALYMPLKLPKAGKWVRQFCLYGVFTLEHD